MWRFMFLTFVIFGHCVLLKSQPICGNNPIAGDFCSTATAICNLNGYCGNTSSSYSNWVSTSNHANESNTQLGSLFCASIQNNSWIKFIANASTAVFSVWVSNCAIGRGVQMQIYSTIDCYNFTAVSNCWNPQTPTNGQITATGLIPGQVYYFMIDGTQGDNCDYVIAASSGVTTVPTITPNQEICIGQTAHLTATEGTSYLWSSNPTDPSLAGQSTHASISVNPTVNTIYTVAITQEGNNAFCSTSNNTLTSSVTVHSLPLISTINTFEHCHLSDGTGCVLVVGDSNSYHYLWNTTPTQAIQTVENLSEGTYQVTVTDTNGCASIATCSIINVMYLMPQISGDSSFCSGESTFLDAGGNYNGYLWSNGSTSQIISVDHSGLYRVTVSMDNNCIGKDSVIVVENPNPNPIITGTPYYCPDSFTLIDAGSEYSSYLWSTGSTNQSIYVNTQNTYFVTVTDENGCSAYTNLYVYDNNGPYLTVSSVSEICDHRDGVVTVFASGGLGTYTYLWSNGTTTAIDSGLCQGDYIVTVSDGNCNVSKVVTVYEIQGPTANFIVSPTNLILLEKYVTAKLYDNSSGNIINWQWNFGDTTNIEEGTAIEHNYYNIGCYNVSLIVTDTNNCADTLYKEVCVKDYFTFYIPNCFSPSNNDDLNSWFYPKGINWSANGFKMIIYDRWGNVMFKTSDIENCKWNGTLNNSGTANEAVIGVYTYFIKVVENTLVAHEYIGSVTLIK